MAVPQIGIKFNLKKNWKMLFENDTWFMWQDRTVEMGYVLRRFTVPNVFKWYFYQFVIWLLMKKLRPLALISEGKQFMEVTRIPIRKAITPIKFFRLGK